MYNQNISPFKIPTKIARYNNLILFEPKFIFSENRKLQKDKKKDGFIYKF